MLLRAQSAGGASPCYGTIQAAVDAAANGDEIRVAAGAYTGAKAKVSSLTGFTYTQIVMIDGKSLTLKGGYIASNWNAYTPASNPTIIDAQNFGRGITILGDGTQAVSILGFQIINGDYTNLGNPPGVANAACYGTGGDCAGGLLAYFVKLVLNDVQIRNNTAGRIRPFSVGGGALLWKTTEGTLIENTQVFGNTTTVEGYAGGIEVHYAVGGLTIRNSQFDDNHSAFDGGGLRLTSITGPVVIENSRFVGNSAVGRSDALGGAISANMLDDLLLDRVEFRNNRAAEDGAALYVRHVGTEKPTLSLVNVLAAENRIQGAHTYGAPIHFLGGPGDAMKINIQQMTVAANQTPAAIHAAQNSDSNAKPMTITMTNTLFADVKYGIVGAQRSSSMSISHTNSLFHNVPSQTEVEDGAPTFSAVGALTGDPKLDANQRLQSGSAAIDTGVNTGIALDLDGGVRPGGAAHDIGADEYAAASPGSFRFAKATYAVSEGESTTITVERVNGTTGVVSVEYATSDSTASAGSDYTATSGTLTFAAGETTKIFALTSIQDSSDETDETVVLALSTPKGGATLGTPYQATVVIGDDDVGNAGEIRFERATFNVLERSGTATIAVVRTGSSSGPVSVGYVSSDDVSQSNSATAGSDYTATSGTLNFADGETRKTFSVPVIDDGFAENDETVRLVLANVTGGATLSVPSEARLIIQDGRALFLPIVKW